MKSSMCSRSLDMDWGSIFVWARSSGIETVNTPISQLLPTNMQRKERNYQRVSIDAPHHRDH